MKLVKLQLSLGALAALVSAPLFAAYRTQPIVAHWTGAVDSSWVNDDNWEVEGTGEHIAPGVILSDAAVTKRGNWGHKQDQAVFDRVSENTTIGLRGVTCIGNVTVSGATTPKYMFGSTSDIYQILPMGQGSTFTVAADVVNTPVLECSLSIGTYAESADGNFTLCNNSAGCLEVKQWFGFIYDDPNGTYKGKSSDNTWFWVKGSGDVCLTKGVNTANRRVVMQLQQSSNSRLILKADTYLYSLYNKRTDSGVQQVEVKAGGILRFNSGADNQICDDSTVCQLRVFGDGKVMFSGASDVNGHQRVNGSVCLDCCVDSYITSGTMSRGVAFEKNYSGKIKLTCPTNVIPGVIDIGNDGGTLEVAGMGMRGQPGVMGTGNGVRIGNNAVFVYSGAGETTDRALILWGKKAIVQQNGTGEIFLDSDVTAFDASVDLHTLTLRGNAQRAVFMKSIADTSASQPIAVAVESGTWGLTGAQSFTGGFSVSAGATAELYGAGAVASMVQLNSGSTLRVVGTGDAVCSRTLSVRNAAGNNTLVVSGKVAVTLNALERAAGNLAIVVEGDPDSSIHFAGKTSASGGLDWVTINGYSIKGFTDDGKILYDEKISGDQSVVVSGTQRRVLGNAANDYTGTTEVYGLAGASITAMFPGSIPSYAKTKIHGGRITVPVQTPQGVTGWSDAKIVELVNLATLQTNAVVAVDTTKSGDHMLVLDDSKITNAAFGIGSDGENTMAVTGDFTKKVAFASYAGTLKFTGGRHAYGGGLATCDYDRSSPGTVEFNCVTGTISSADEPIVVGGARYSTGQSDALKHCGKVVVRNAMLVNPMSENVDMTTANFVLGGIGQRGVGVLEIEGNDTVVTSSFNVATQWGCRGAVYQRAGKVANWCASADGASCSQLGYNGSGYWELTGGEYAQLGSTRWAANADSVDGIFAQYGGRAEFAAQGEGKVWWFGGGRNSVTDRNLSARALYVNRKGVGYVSDCALQTCWVSPYGMADFVVDGMEASLEFASGCTVECNGTTGSHTAFTLNDGGTLITAKPIQQRYTSSTARELVVNANGGVIRTTADLNLLGPAVGDIRTADRVVVYEKGITFDTNGKTVSIYAPIVKPTGYGIKSVKLASWVNELAGLVGAPGLNVYDGVGHDATLVAEFDSMRNCVTNIRVACSGFGYTSAPPQIDLRYANNRYASTASKSPFGAIEMYEPQGGPLVKVGEGTLVLGTANTYAGSTVVSNGTLRLAAANALPANTALELAGGTLDLNGNMATISSMKLAGGKLMGAPVGFVGPADYTFDILAPQTVVFTEKVVFPPNARVMVLNADKADPEKKYRLMEFKAGYEGPKPALVGFEGVDPEWHLVCGASLHLSVVRGLCIKVR